MYLVGTALFICLRLIAHGSLPCTDAQAWQAPSILLVNVEYWNNGRHKPDAPKMPTSTLVGYEI